MSFKKNEGTGSKNMYVATLVSQHGSDIGWIHLNNTFARRVCGVMNVTDITAEQVEKSLPELFEGAKVTVRITDTTEALVPVDAKDF